MSNQIELKVTLTFSEEIPSKEVRANITENVIDALDIHRERSDVGLAGDDLEGYTTAIEVSSPELTKYWNESEGIQTA